MERLPRGRHLGQWQHGGPRYHLCVSGSISADHSLARTDRHDLVSVVCGKVLPVTNGNYARPTSDLNHTRGAVTWANGNTGITGTVSEDNSLVGSKPNDGVGNF